MIIVKFGWIDTNLPKYQQLGEVLNTPRETVHIKDERLLYPSSPKTTETDSPVNFIHYKPSQTVWNKW